jgi:hypothetical protein
MQLRWSLHLVLLLCIVLCSASSSAVCFCISKLHFNKYKVVTCIAPHCCPCCCVAAALALMILYIHQTTDFNKASQGSVTTDLHSCFGVHDAVIDDSSLLLLSATTLLVRHLSAPTALYSSTHIRLVVPPSALARSGV